MLATQMAPVVARKSLANTYQYAGGIITILLNGADTNGAFSMWEAVQKPGSEPPGVLPLSVTRPVLNPAVNDSNLNHTVCTGTSKYRPPVASPPPPST